MQVDVHHSCDEVFLQFPPAISNKNENGKAWFNLAQLKALISTQEKHKNHSLPYSWLYNSGIWLAKRIN